MQPIEQYKQLCLLAVIILIFGLSFLIWKWPQGKHMTFSRHAARHRTAIIYYFLLFTVVLPLLLLFFIGWFAPTFQLSFLFVSFVVGAVLFQYSVVIVPETSGWKASYHIFGSAVSATFMLLILTSLLFAPTISTSGKTVTLAALAAMAIPIYIGSVNKIQHSNLLLLQAGFYAAFFAAILYVTYLG